MQWSRSLKVTFFAVAYFLAYLASFVFYMTREYAGDLGMTWYFQHPLEALRMMIHELVHNPLLILPLTLMILWSLVLGFMTDLMLILIKKRIQSRKQRTHNP